MTALVQSSTAIALIVAAFVGQCLMTLPSALTVMPGGDIGTSLMVVAFSRDLERPCASTHLGRLALNTVQSIETSSLHLDQIGDPKRINSHICSIVYPILDSAGALAPRRLKQSVLDAQS